MTIRTKRRGRRSLAAILAAMLMASVLAVVAASPAQAANTSFEVKIDHDDNAATDPAREFAGQDRYDTALLLAKNFAKSKGGLGAVPAAFVSSGETLVDSISVAGLAGYVDAPILLTPSDSLHGGVADFIEDYGVGTVYVLGGSAAVADSVVTSIEDLSASPQVTRIAGDDRYATAAEIASMIDAESSWCGSDATSAVLINGASDMMPYGVAVQTIAYRLQLPVLMTAADELPDATAEYITANDVEHVQIIGGTGAVSADAASALTTLGVDTVDRVAGDSASAVSVELANMAGNGCGDDLGLVSTNRVALVRGNPDGVVAAPVLASSLADGYLVPPLVVGDSLPASVSDYLAATPKAVGVNKLNLGIVAVGGTAAVSEATMSAALTAAASSGALSVEIGAAKDTTGDRVESASDPVRPQANNPTASPPEVPMFTLYFNDDVDFADNATLLGEIRDIIEVNGVPAVVSAVARSADGGTCDNRRIDVTLGQALRHGDTISVASSGHTLGTATDQRTVAPTSTTVMAAPADRGRPTASILGIAQAATDLTGFTATNFTVTFSDAGGFPAIAEDTITGDDFTFVKGAGSEDATISDVQQLVVTDGAKRFSVTVTINRDLAVGDRLVVKPGVVGDKAVPLANMNVGTSGTAIKAQASPRITAVLMSNLKHNERNTWTVPDRLVRGATGNHAITISAKAGGDADGAAGNDWTVVFDRSSTHSSAKPLDIDVRVDTKGQRVTVRFVNGPPTATLGDLLAELKANAEFDSRFSAGFTDCAAGRGTTLLGLEATAAGRDSVAATTNAGRTQFAIEVRFNAWVHDVNHDQLLADVLAAAARRAGTTNDASGIRAAATSDAEAASGGLSLDSPPEFDGPSRTVRYEGETALMSNLPLARDLVDTKAGHQGATTAITGPPAYKAIIPMTAVATGYAADVTTPAPANEADDASDRVDEDKNGASQNRISVSNSVKARD